MNTHILKRWSKANAGLLFCGMLLLSLTVTYGLGLVSPILGLVLCGVVLAGYGAYFWVYYRWYRTLDDLAGFSEYYHEIFRLHCYMFALLCLLGFLALIFYLSGQIFPLYTMPEQWNHPLWIGIRLVAEVVDALSLGWVSMFEVNLFDMTFTSTTSQVFFKTISTMTEVLIIARLINVYKDWKQDNADIKDIFTKELAYHNYMVHLGPRKIRALLKCLPERTDPEDKVKILNGLRNKEHGDVRNAFLEQLQTTDNLRVAEACVRYFSVHRDRRFRRVCRALKKGPVREFVESAVPQAFAKPLKRPARPVREKTRQKSNSARR